MQMAALMAARFTINAPNGAASNVPAALLSTNGRAGVW